MVNGGPSIFFRHLEDSDKGTLPMLFIVITEALNKMLIRAREIDLFKLKVGGGVNAEEIIHLLFTDDIMIFCEQDKRVMRNLRCILMSF